LEELMAYALNRFLTTHTGSLPRPDDLIRAMFAKEEGVPVDRAALGARILAAVAEVVKKQVEAGVDLVNDGEMSRRPQGRSGGKSSACTSLVLPEVRGGGCESLRLP
jgi:hypothetical protein